MNDLADYFKDAGYPEKMVRNITTKVLHSERDISTKEKVDRKSDEIRVVSTYKADELRTFPEVDPKFQK